MQEKTRDLKWKLNFCIAVVWTNFSSSDVDEATIVIEKNYCTEISTINNNNLQ